jgi:hypothetical protein
MLIVGFSDSIWYMANYLVMIWLPSGWLSTLCKALIFSRDKPFSGWSISMPLLRVRSTDGFNSCR